MALETKIIEEFHPNGKLKYVETIVVVPNADLHLYKNCNLNINSKGEHWMRTGKNAKYHDNGQMAWEINYDEKGNVIKDRSNKQFRKDGTIVV